MQWISSRFQTRKSLQITSSVHLPINYIVPDSCFFFIYLFHTNIYCFVFFFLLCLPYLWSHCRLSKKNPVHAIKNPQPADETGAIGHFDKCCNGRLHRFIWGPTRRAFDTLGGQLEKAPWKWKRCNPHWVLEKVDKLYLHENKAIGWNSRQRYQIYKGLANETAWQSAEAVVSDGQSERENTKGRWGLYHQGSYMLLRSFIFLMVFNFLIKKIRN